MKNKSFIDIVNQFGIKLLLVRIIVFYTKSPEEAKKIKKIKFELYMLIF
jgi:hypothetical protein